MVAHALIYPNNYSMIIAIIGYIIALGSTVIYGLCKFPSETSSGNLSQTNLGSKDTIKNVQSFNELALFKPSTSKIAIRSHAGIQASTEPDPLLKKSIDIDSRMYKVQYTKPDEEEDYKEDYKEDYIPGYQ